MQCLSHQAAETLGIFLRSWSKKSPAMQSVFLQVCATTDIPVFNSRWRWRAGLSSLGPDDLLQMQQRWEGENHREAKCRKTNRRETKCRNGSEEKQNVESVQCMETTGTIPTAPRSPLFSQFVSANSLTLFGNNQMAIMVVTV